MEKIQKVSSILVKIFNGIMGWYVISSLMMWLFPSSLIGRFFLTHHSAVETPEGLVQISNVRFTPLTQSIGFSADVLGVLPLILGLFVLKSLFRHYGKGEIFTTSNARHYQYLGWLCFINALLIQPLANLLLVLSVTLSNPPGHRYITLSFGTPGLEWILSGLLILVISWIMGEASKLQDEQKLTI